MDQFSSHGNHPRFDRGHRSVESRGIDRLPRDLLIEVLSRLPTKILCRCRCVSKSWLYLLSFDRDFISRHEEWSKKQPLMLVRRYVSNGIGELNRRKITMELTTIDMEGHVTDKFQKVIDGPVHSFISCGPLAAFCSMYSLYVCNPSIQQLVRVPSSPNSRIFSIGFGYLPASGEYKVVHMFYLSCVGKGKMGCEIFSFRAIQGVKSGHWRTIRDCPYNTWTDEYPVCINGTMYWGDLSSGWKERSFMSLDLETEEFNRVLYPGKHTLLGYTGLMGALSVVGFSADMSTIDVWMMKDKKSNKWEMEYSIKVFPWCPKFLVPFGYDSEEIMVHMEQKDLISYSLRDQSYRETGFYKAMKIFNKPSVYYGSLAAVGSGA